MVDRISSLSDETLCYILSFLPTKVAVSTSILSSRWKPLWRFVPALEFGYDSSAYLHHKAKESFYRFVQSVYTYILSRDLELPLQRFQLTCRNCLLDSSVVNAWLNAAVHHRVQGLYLSIYISSLEIFSNVRCCKTLVVLKLELLQVKSFCSVELPSLKILHFYRVIFSDGNTLATLLSGTPNLEDLQISDVRFCDHATQVMYRKLTKLIRAAIDKNAVPFDILYNVHSLRIDYMAEKYIEDQIPNFQNLTRIQLHYWDYARYLTDMFEVLEYCPKLQNLSVVMKFSDNGPTPDWSCPPSVPKCISFHLKSCCLNNYGGTAGESKFAKYIMQNARVLVDMRIYTCKHEKEKEKLEMIKELSLCRRISSACELSFN